MATAPSQVLYASMRMHSAGRRPIMAESFPSAPSSHDQPEAVAVAGRVTYKYNASSCKPTITTAGSCEEALQTISSSAAAAVSAAAAASSPFKARRSSIIRLPTSQDVRALQMPALHCTFPSLVNPLYESVKEECDAWIEAVAQPPSAAARRFLHDCLLPLFVCRMVPEARSKLRLVHAIKAIAWLMIADDDDDCPDALGSDSATTGHRADIVMAILRNNPDASRSLDHSFLAHTQPGFASKSAAMLQAFEELWDGMGREMPSSVRDRFISTMADYFEGIKAQASFREQHCVPDVESYMEIRRQASFTIPIFVLMEYALDIELDDATFYSPCIQELHNDALDYISLCNDILSCPKEISMGDYFNLPFILYSSTTASAQYPWKFTTFQDAVDHVAQVTKNLNTHASFLISLIIEETKHTKPYMVPTISTYLDGLSLCMSGAITWFHETARYHQSYAHK